MAITRFPAGSGKVEAFLRQQLQPITWLSGCVVDEALGQRSDFGILLTPLMGNRPKQLGAHAHDNGVYSEFKSGIPFNLDKFLRHLDKWANWAGRCLFASAPDVVGDWAGSIERSLPIFPLIRERGYKPAFCAQDDVEHHLGAIPWSQFDVLFLGGGQHEKYLSPTNRVRTRDGRWVGEWKCSPGAAKVAREARQRGKQVHMGRVNSGRRLRLAQSFGCTSADGTYLGIAGRQHVGTVHGWLDDCNSEVSA